MVPNSTAEYESSLADFVVQPHKEPDSCLVCQVRVCVAASTSPTSSKADQWPARLTPCLLQHASCRSPRRLTHALVHTYALSTLAGGCWHHVVSQGWTEETA
ncbi:unnamed protein product [Protopolystoma xenopodis]|uniref:Uncharacterized protein n=1 Tax=Protopolystoma xenopodis TaxID=117903 RepID=A0A448WKH9_9PLAT|nr:unnamed protein product [Protopolystoma xenopodis]